MVSVNSFHLHLVSDATGETISSMVRACLVQFEDVAIEEHAWFLVRTPSQIQRILDAVEKDRGIVLFTLVNSSLREALEEGCARLKIPCIPALDPVMGALRGYFGVESKDQPGRQHALDEEYYRRIDAMNFALLHDDGQHVRDLNNADVVLVGVSRTSKTPTCVYLANRGIRAANVPIIPGSPLLNAVDRTTKPLVVGLTMDPARLVEARQLRMPQAGAMDDYADFEKVREEMLDARRLFTERDWPVIDVTRRSVEETASAILQLYAERRKPDRHA
ncbi:MAG: kinase/pyrophosphorylase [Alphaproteobacteria bacterium]|nr:kinase/pyrophosphorylase [Alphaproteobacteria bacterium]